MIEASALFDVDPPAQSRLLATDVAHFGRLLVTDDTVLIRLDPTVIALPGSTVTSCDHAKPP